MKKYKRFSSLSIIMLVFVLLLSSCTNMYDPEKDDYLYAESSEAKENSAGSSTEHSQESSAASSSSKESSMAASSSSKESSQAASSQESSQTASSESSQESSQEGIGYLPSNEIDNKIDAIDGYHAPKNWQQLYPNGSAGELSGTIAVVSIFVDVNGQNWDFDDEEDYEAYSMAYYDLKYATEFLEAESAYYGKEVSFIWDWMNINRLYYTATLNITFDDILAVGDVLDDALWDYIDNNVNSEGIRQVLGADSVIYMAFINSPRDNTQPSCTRNFYNGMPYPYEICYMYMYDTQNLEVPAVFAHEMLHTFGAPDLYWTDSYSVFRMEYGLTKEFADYVKSNELNDIMRITWDPNTGTSLPTTIAQHITEITAYYIGLIDHSDLVDEWGFDPSEHID